MELNYHPFWVYQIVENNDVVFQQLDLAKYEELGETFVTRDMNVINVRFVGATKKQVAEKALDNIKTQLFKLEKFKNQCLTVIEEKENV